MDVQCSVLASSFDSRFSSWCLYQPGFLCSLSPALLSSALFVGKGASLFKSNPHEQIFCGKLFDKDICSCIKTTNAMLKNCFPKRHKLLWIVETKPKKPLPSCVNGWNFVTGRAHEQTFLHDIFSLQHKNRRISLSAKTFVTKLGQIFSCTRTNKNSRRKLATENLLAWTRLYTFGGQFQLTMIDSGSWPIRCILTTSLALPGESVVWNLT